MGNRLRTYFEIFFEAFEIRKALTLLRFSRSEIEKHTKHRFEHLKKIKDLLAMFRATERGIFLQTEFWEKVHSSRHLL